MSRIFLKNICKQENQRNCPSDFLPGTVYKDENDDDENY